MTAEDERKDLTARIKAAPFFAKDVAAKLGWAPSKLSRMLRGEYKISLDERDEIRAAIDKLEARK